MIFKSALIELIIIYEGLFDYLKKVSNFDFT